jgi:hypothetical protein
MGRSPFTGPWGRLEKFLPFYFRIYNLLLENERNALN